MALIKSLCLSALCLSSIISTATSQTLPFTRIVAFGDNLSDNGNGSVAHGVAQPGQPKNKIYGYNTWTNGPVAVMYLTNLLGKKTLPLLDYAFGHADGGSKFGATIDNAYTKSPAGAPSTKQQIANYTNDPARGTPQDVASSLHFLWIGANDINLYHIQVAQPLSKGFGDTFTPLLVAQVDSLLALGAKYIVVPTLYPKQIAPSRIYYCGNNATRWDYLGNAISYANTQITKALSAPKYRKNVLVFDAFASMMYMQNNHVSLGIEHVAPEFCDGQSNANFKDCITDGNGNAWYWTQVLDPTTHIHQTVATGISNAIKQKWAA